MNYKWQIQTAPDADVREYMQELNASRILAAGLIRNRLPVEMADKIINVEDYDDFFAPLSIYNIRIAAEAIKEHLAKPKAMIQIFADYDTDGITSATIACRGLREIAKSLYPDKPIKIDCYVPERKDGYGLSVGFAEDFTRWIKEEWSDTEVLVLTVDNGITAKPAVDILQQSPNIRVIVTDHHLPDYENGLTPDQDCICVDPHIEGGEFPIGKCLAGCGVIFNLLQELEIVCGLSCKATTQLYYLAAIGTIGDMMDMDFYNACLVNAGVIQLNLIQSLSNWVGCLRDKAGISRFTTKDLAFTVSPMINGCGQQGEAILAFKMLAARHDDEMVERFEEVYRLYQKNKIETKDAREAAELDILENYIDQHPFVMYPMQTNQPGLVSKVATHLAKQLQVPILLWAETDENAEDEIIPGSARNDTSLPVLQIMREAVRKGLANSAEGHIYAFGVKLYRSKLPELQQFLDDKIRSYGADIGAVTSRNLIIDCIASTDDINTKTMRDLERFPFAKNLVAPVVLIQKARILKVKASKNNPKNICYTIQSPGATYPIDIWAWNIKPDEYREGVHTEIDIVGTIERNFMRPDYATLSVIDLRCY